MNRNKNTVKIYKEDIYIYIYVDISLQIWTLKNKLATYRKPQNIIEQCDTFNL